MRSKNTTPVSEPKYCAVPSPLFGLEWRNLADGELSKLSPLLRLAPGDWQSGDNLWLIDLACPFGGTGEAVQQLREQTFKDQTVKTVRANSDGTGFEAGVWAE